MYVILSTKPGQFRTELTEGLTPIEAYDYVFYGRMRARFLIAEISAPTRIRIVDETEPITVNDVPSKFLEKFERIEGARRELQFLCAFGDMDTTLVPRDVSAFNAPVAEAA
jgi:hypothetical protein